MEMFNPREAVRYWTENYNVVRSKNTLAKWRVLGGGPDFQKIGPNVLYSKEALDRWIAEHLTKAVSSTSSLSPRGSGRGVPATNDRAGAEQADTELDVFAADPHEASAPAHSSGMLEEMRRSHDSHAQK